jgi:ATP-dependent helicase/DNAse subunit B
VDGELYTWRALDALRASPGAWGSDAVFFYGFDDLHPLERDAVETLARVVGAEVTVSLTYEPARSAFQARAEVVEELRPLAQRVLELPALDEHYAAASRAVLHHLERHLFDPAPERVEPDGAVRLLEAGGELAEAELIAAEVLELLRAGVPAGEIVVVCRSLIRAAPLLERVFERYGIPTSTRRAARFGDTALGRGVLGLTRCGLLDERRTAAEELLCYLRSPGLLDRPEVADRLESEVRRDALRTLAKARERLGWNLREIDALRAADDPAAELARQGRRLLAAQGAGTAPVLEGEQQLDARALAAMLRALGELEQIGERLSGPELIELLERLELPVGGATALSDAVLVTEPLSIRARRFRAVFVCGLQEGEFPRASAPEPFLSDERRRELARCSGLRLRPSEDALARERYLLYSCVSRASECLVLSYRSADEEGNLALPSPFLADIAALLPADWAERRRRRMLADVVWSPDEAPTERELARARAAAAPVPGGPQSPLRPLTEEAMEHVRHRQILSAGALECYADCPVKWLVERELRPAPLAPDPDPVTRGAYMHVALEELVRRLGMAVTEESLPDALRILEELLEELPAEVAPGRAEGVRAAARRRIAADLRRYLEHEAADGCGWEPQELELQFGFTEEEGSLPPLELGEGQDRIFLRGVVDRVDVDPTGSRRAIIRDYKSGAVRPAYQGAHWGADRQLQVALYMLAVRELLGLEPVAGLYQPLGGGDLRARGIYLKEASLGSRLVGNDGLDQQQLSAELDDTAARALAVALRLRAGELAPSPVTCSRDGCRYPEICRAG